METVLPKLNHKKETTDAVPLPNTPTRSSKTMISWIIHREITRNAQRFADYQTSVLTSSGEEHDQNESSRETCYERDAKVDERGRVHE